MLKLILFLGCLIAASFVLWSGMISLSDIKTFVKINHYLTGVEEENSESSKIEPVSENDVNQKLKMDMELKNFYQVEDALGKSSKRKYEDLIKTLDNYIQRYISLFLITSNLVEYPVKELDEMITIDLEITISGEDLAYLQGFSKSGKDLTHTKKLSKLDDIFSKIARLKKRTYMENAFRYSKSFIASVIFKILDNPSFYNYLPFLMIFIVVCLSYNFVLYNPFVCAVVIMNSLIIWDSLNLYWKRIKEVDIEIYVKAMQFKVIPEDCDPSKMWWYQRIFSFQNHCLQYFQNINKNAIEEVSILKCIVDTYSFYLIQTPFRVLGASLRDFTGEISELWPWPFKYFISVPFAFFFAVSIAFFMLVLCGKRLRLSFFGAAVEVGDAKPPIATERLPPICDSEAKGCRDIRKLKPWTNVRFPKRLDRDLGARRRLMLKTLKSFSEMPGDAIKAACNLTEKANGQKAE